MWSASAPEPPSRAATSSIPWRNGGATRGNGGRPSSTSSRPVSSPYRYSLGPATIPTLASLNQSPSSASISAMAAARRSRSPPKVSLRANTMRSAPTANAATRAPSTTAKGLARRMARSLKVPGSPSAPLTTTVGATAAVPP
jgi:hypothetical protein